jgi:hypothetical protein
MLCCFVDGLGDAFSAKPFFILSRSLVPQKRPVDAPRERLRARRCRPRGILPLLRWVTAGINDFTPS